jgi:hypothetical protein
VMWALKGNYWAILRGGHGFDAHGELNEVFSAEELTGYASRVRPIDYDHAAPVKLGYLPAGLVFSGASASPGTHAVPGSRQSEEINLAEPTADGGAPGSSGYSMWFTPAEARVDQISAPLTVDVIENAQQNWSKATASDPPVLTFPGPWRRTTIHGHLAWESPRAVLIQWGDLQIGVTTPTNKTDHIQGVLSEEQLISVAKSLVVPNQRGFDHGFPLLSSGPPGFL